MFILEPASQDYERRWTNRVGRNLDLIVDVALPKCNGTASSVDSMPNLTICPGNEVVHVRRIGVAAVMLPPGEFTVE